MALAPTQKAVQSSAIRASGDIAGDYLLTGM